MSYANHVVCCFCYFSKQTCNIQVGGSFNNARRQIFELPSLRFLASSSSSSLNNQKDVTKPNSDVKKIINNSSLPKFPDYPLVDGQDKLKIQPIAEIGYTKPPWWATIGWNSTAQASSNDSTSSTSSPTTASSSFSSSQKQQNTIVHVVKGGLPCDTHIPQFELSNYGKEALYTLVLLRHGESEWNLQNKFTGWCDVPLTDRGRQEAHDAGRLLRQNSIEVDLAFTSFLQRAIFTTNMALNTSKQHWVPVTKTWRLNERHYGALQGYNKDTAFNELMLDEELVMEMRRSCKSFKNIPYSRILFF